MNYLLKAVDGRTIQVDRDTAIAVVLDTIGEGGYNERGTMRAMSAIHRLEEGEELNLNGVWKIERLVA